MNVKWKLTPDGKGGWAGEIIMVSTAVPGGAAITTVARAKGKGPDAKANALAKASALADQLMSNPALAAIMPPQAAVAVKAIKVLSKGAAAGKLAEVAKSFTGPAVSRLTKALGGIF